MANFLIDSRKTLTYDAIVVGSGISGGWAAKELTQQGLRTLLLERGRPVNHVTDYPTATLNPWELEHRGQVPLDIRKEYSIASRNYAFHEDTMHFFAKDSEQPYYFKHYAYTLWNAGNTQKELYLDGFRNQPFSSILAFLGEYGLLFFLVFFWLYFRYYKIVSGIYRERPHDRLATVHFRMFKFLTILLPLLLLIDNYYEYPEMMLLVIIGMKLAHMAILQRTSLMPNPA